MASENPFDQFEKVLLATLPGTSTQEISPDDRLADLGLNSLLLVQLVVQIEEEFGINMPDETLTEETFHSVDTLWSTVSAVRQSRPQVG
ncbi:phosphopantetheine-binding protein [Verrucosispora sp. WMMD573]|uniref:phosphopantetheine-binding protein n=1 Tax=Verrucosispora sp. WMMD573 TaxID=3015149 RepID=UPI00248CB5C5|nr:phosphopantetheine-binding protein [Verrucosispora sp. WMMD573]WBB53723.1 phosphopantetheine-binding protein [Verrucosispora sp. WMMD573]